jgi:hypothetical protein
MSKSQSRGTRNMKVHFKINKIYGLKKKELLKFNIKKKKYEKAMEYGSSKGQPHNEGSD